MKNGKGNSSEEITAEHDQASTELANAAGVFTTIGSRALEASRSVRGLEGAKRDDCLRDSARAIRLAVDAGHVYARVIELLIRG